MQRALILVIHLLIAAAIFGAARRDGESSATIQLAHATTGKVLGEMNCPEECWTIKVSPDLRRVACSNSVKGLQMWDLQPAARWPWAFAVALLPSALWLTVHRLRRPRNAPNGQPATTDR